MGDLKIKDQTKALLMLIDRSPDIGDGWRQCGPQIWTAVKHWMKDGLTEADEDQKRIRLTEEGKTLVKYMKPTTPAGCRDDE